MEGEPNLPFTTSTILAFVILQRRATEKLIKVPSVRVAIADSLCRFDFLVLLGLSAGMWRDPKARLKAMSVCRTHAFEVLAMCRRFGAACMQVGG
jgi:hypothetical protein